MNARSMATLSVSVIIPVHNGGENFFKCLSALAQTDPPPYEIIVVTDGSTDDSAQVAQEFGARVISTPTRSGPARARNLGARAARGDILFFMDADVLAYPDAMHQVAAIFGQAPDLAAAFGSYDGDPAATNFLSQYKNLLHHYVHQISNEEAFTFWSGCGAVRRDVFLTLGGFDESYRRPAIEDIELGYRLRNAGYRIRLDKTLQVKHLKYWGLNSLLKADFLHRALPWTALIWRDRQLANDLNLRYSSRASVMLVYILLGALVGAWWWPGLWAVAGIAAVLLLALNAALYRFFLRQRGIRFALQAIPWHWLYYLYGGLAFVIGTARHLSGKWSPLRPTISARSKQQPRAKNDLDPK